MSSAVIPKGELRGLDEANKRLATLRTRIGKHNERLSTFLDAFLVRVDAECVEGREPSTMWLRAFKKLSNDVNEHVATCERHAMETRALVLLKTISNNARAKKLLKDVKQLSLSVDFRAPAII